MSSESPALTGELKASSKLSYSFMKYMNQFDKFGTSVPSFNVKGDNTINSNVGSILTLISAVVVLIYAVAKTSHIQSVNG